MLEVSGRTWVFHPPSKDRYSTAISSLNDPPQLPQRDKVHHEGQGNQESGTQSHGKPGQQLCARRRVKDLDRTRIRGDAESDRDDQVLTSKRSETETSERGGG